MQKTGLHRVTNYKNRWMAVYLMETCLLSVAAACCALLVSQLMFQNQMLAIGLGVFAFSLPVLFFLRGFKRISIPNVLRLLSVQNTDLQNSAELLVQDSLSLTRLEQLQKTYVDELILQSQIIFSIPHKMKIVISILVLCFGAFASSIYLNDILTKKKDIDSATDNYQTTETIEVTKKKGLNNHSIKITPPEYTNQKIHIQKDWDIVVPEGSNIEWHLTFHDYVEQVILRFSDKREFSLRRVGNSFMTSVSIHNRMLYELLYTDSTGNTIYSDFHKIDIIYDTPPQVEVRGIDQFSEHEFDGDNEFDLQVSLSDDYGISDAYIIATIAQGSGESVMFREEKMRFDKQIRSNVKNASVPKHLSLNAFGMQPGDELYFYIEAKDNCTLKNNVTRTETYILSIRDTATYVFDLAGGLGVDLMPEYFRSQRQIIIDTEKLLKNQPDLILHDFNATSNELGFDQKSLRLKYGQFLGEEDESGIAIEDHEADEEEHVSEEEGGEEEDPLEGFKHDHDNEDEHERTNEGETQENPLDEYQHAHDSEEVATFFTNTLKGKLKAAMSLMWDAELYLRLYEPKKSLPYQYKALKLIKEIKNHARVYVHRIGFDPPPIKEESRLSGDLSEVNDNRLYSYDSLKDNQAIRKVISLIVDNNNTNEKQNMVSISLLQQAGIELAQIAIDNPGKYIYGLQILRDWINGEELSKKKLTFLQYELIKSLPKESLYAEDRRTTLDPLTKTFLQILEEKENTYDR